MGNAAAAHTAVVHRLISPRVGSRRKNRDIKQVMEERPDSEKEHRPHPAPISRLKKSNDENQKTDEPDREEEDG